MAYCGLVSPYGVIELDRKNMPDDSESDSFDTADTFPIANSVIWVLN